MRAFKSFRNFLAIALTLGLTLSLTPAALPVFAASPSALQNGADVSWLPEVERAGSKFYDAKGRKIDPLLLMKQAGLKTARVRLWVQPADQRSSITEVLALAKRIKKAGLGFVLDFHYSDWWADPGSQTIPSAWYGMNQAQLEQKINEYTSSVLARFARQQTSPQWVQIGNEIGNGMLWPAGKLNSWSSEEFKRLTGLLNSAALAVRASSGKPKVMIHLETGGDSNKTSNWLRMALANGLTRPDAIGLSYYSQWGGALSNLEKTISIVANEYNFAVAIAETAYMNSMTAPTKQVLDSSKAALPGFAISTSGQAAYATKTCAVLRANAGTKSLGVWWWEGFSPNKAKLTDELGASYISSSSLVTLAGRANAAMLALGKCK
jgi:arabinogalactan endo-1,4-beta-galactosidase